MWLYMIGGALVVLGIIGAAVGGGIFTIVLLPLGLIVLGSAVLYGLWGRAAQGAAGGETEASVNDQPLPHSTEREPARVTASPERLADARRSQQ